MDGSRTPASTSSPATTDLRCMILSATTTNTTTSMAKIIRTAPTTTIAGIAAPRDRPKTLRSMRYGNNNAYCQDNEITWLDWNITDEQRAFFSFVRSVINIRQTQPVFQRRKFFQGR